MVNSETPKRLVTVQDVAQNAGVSKATAARVLGRYGTTSSAVKEKVLAAAQELGYQANELARSMTTGRSGIIGVIVGDIENPYFGLAVRGITDAARAEIRRHPGELGRRNREGTGCRPGSNGQEG